MPVFRTLTATDGDVRLEAISMPKTDVVFLLVRDYETPLGRLLFETRHPGRRWRGPRNRRITNRPSRLKVHRGKRYTINARRAL